METDPDETDWRPDPAIIICPECLGEVFEDAERCPECGHNFTSDDRRAGRPAWYKIAIAFIVGLLVWRIISHW